MSVYVICPEVKTAVGGARRLYLWVDILNSAGIDASIVHDTPDFRLSSFANATAVVSSRDLVLEPEDVVAVPGDLAEQLVPVVAPGLRKVVLDQGAYESFLGFGFDPPRSSPYLSPEVVAVATVSEDSRTYLQYLFPTLEVFRIHYGMESQFHPPASKPGRVISFMPRKMRKQATQVIRMLHERGVLSGWELRPLDGLSYAEVAEQLRATAIFLSFSDREGFGLPPAEAMACGCVVVGYAGGGGLEFFLPETSVLIDDGEIVEFAQAVEAVAADFESFAARGTAASEFIRSTYTVDREKQDVMALFESARSAALPTQAGRPASRLQAPINREPSKYRTAARHAKQAAEALLGR